jgi:hypothetical protein
VVWQRTTSPTGIFTAGTMKKAQKDDLKVIEFYERNQTKEENESTH